MRKFLLLLALLAAGCGSLPSLPDIKLWPFGEEKRQDLDRRPQGSTEYRCDGGKVFYVRRLDDSAVWLIAPDREIRLAKLNDAGRYGVARTVLEMHGDVATLTDPPASFSGCKRHAGG